LSKQPACILYYYKTTCRPTRIPMAGRSGRQLIKLKDIFEDTKLEVVELDLYRIWGLTLDTSNKN
jgi:hypothetical protein